MSTTKLEEYKKMNHDLANIDPNRGGSPNKSKGYYAEIVNTTENNLERIKNNTAARECVINNNGPADAIVVYKNGQTGRQIQDKVGYTFSQLKNNINSGKYDNMIFRINKDHPVLKNKKAINLLKQEARQHNIKIEIGKTTEKEVLELAKNTTNESKLRNAIGLDDTKAPVSASVFTAKTFLKDSVKNSKDFISENTGRFMSENFKQINAAGVDEAVNSAMFAAVLSTTKNTISVIKGEESATEAIKEILYDTSSAAVLGYATGVVKDVFNIGELGDAALLVNGTIQISKQVFSYVNGEIDERQLLNNVAESTAYLAAAYVGRIIGSQLIPIPIVGSYIGEMITTAICSEVISTIKTTKEFEKKNKKYISLYHRAEREIKASNERLKSIIEAENEELKIIIREGFESIYNGINDNSYDLMIKGLGAIGSKFGISEEELKKDRVTRENIFKNRDKVITIGKGV